ncbi:MAG: ABC transporter permease [Lachnospiraceae bacterium]|nr:ABC transporter permease [Lachnospiraceae bacterium]
MKLRNCLSFSISHLHNKKRLFYINSFIMVVSIIMAFRVLLVYVACNLEIIQAHDFLGNRRNQLYKLESNYLVWDFGYSEKYHDCIMELRDKYDVVLYDNTGIFPTGDFKQDIIDYTLMNTEDDMVFQTGVPQLLLADNELLEVTEVKDINGNLIRLGIADDKIEVAVGSFYEKIMPIGTVFSDRDTNQEYIVAYILADNQEWMYGAVYNGGVLKSMNEWIVALPDMERYAGGFVSYMNDVYLLANKDEAGYIKAEIEKIADKYGVYLSVESFDDYEKSYKALKHDMYFFSNVLVILLCISAMVAVITISLVAWLKDYHDIGVLCTNGFLNGDFFKIILIENLIKLIFPGVIAFAILWVGDIGRDLPLKLFNITFLIVILLFLICTVIVSCIIYREFRRNSPVNLIKGER